MSLKNRLVDLLMLVPAMLATIRGARYFQSLGPDSWQSTDWLISYESGPIRRGLSGTLLRQAAEYFPHLAIVKVSFILTALAALAVSAYVCKRTAGMNYLRRLALAYSPFMFSMYWLYDPQGGGRKEVLAILIVLALSVFRGLGSGAAKWSRSVLAWLVLPLAVLTHEAIFFFAVPFLILSSLLSETDYQLKAPIASRTTYAIARLAMICVPSLLALFFSASYASPTAIEVGEICKSWQGVYPSLSCEPLPAALKALANKELYSNMIKDAYFTPSMYRQWLQAAAYAALLILTCLLPMIPGRPLPGNKTWGSSLASKALSLLAISAFVGIFTIPLYALAIDYGRWMSVSFSMLVIFVLGHRIEIGKISYLSGQIMLRSASYPCLESKSLKFLYSWACPALLLYVAASYVAPHCCMRFLNYSGAWSKASIAIHVLAGNL